MRGIDDSCAQSDVDHERAQVDPDKNTQREQPPFPSRTPASHLSPEVSDAAAAMSHGQHNEYRDHRAVGDQPAICRDDKGPANEVGQQHKNDHLVAYC
jgi:hypothetical protein